MIKLSAFGDFVLSLPAFQAIRRQHDKARITLLTTGPFEALARQSGLFDEVWLDQRARWWRADLWLALSRRLKEARFDRVYDLQRNDRSALYFRLLGGRKPEWVGTIAGCSHRYVKPADRVLHIAEREAAQLKLAGVDVPAAPDLSFLDGDISGFSLAPRFALLVPGGAAHRPEKRWPAVRYAALARELIAHGTMPVLIGGSAETDALAKIAAAAPRARNLCGKTDLGQIAALARKALVAIGNDTGPMHLIAAAGCPSLVLFSKASDPRKIAPRGPAVKIQQAGDLEALSIEAVWMEIQPWLQAGPRGG